MSAAIAFFIVLVIYSHAYQYLWETQIVDLIPGYWYAIICALGLIGWVLSSGRTQKASAYNAHAHKVNQRTLFGWALAFVTLAFLSYLGSSHEPQQLRALKTVVICVGLFGVFLKAFNGEKEVKAARNAMVVVVLASIAMNFIDFVGLYNFSPTKGRAAGMYVNPNLAGFYLVMGMILTVSTLRQKFRLYYCFLVGVGVAMTFSRSSGLMWLVAIYGLSQVGLYRLSRRAMTVLWSGLVVLLLAMQFGQNMVESVGLDRYLSPDAQLRLHLNYRTDQSLQGRVEVAERSWTLIKQAPWFGHGLGAHAVLQTLVEPHNMFLLLGVEMGYLGVVIYAALFAVLWRLGTGISRVFASVLLVGSMFSHNLLEYSAIWLAYAVLSGITAFQRMPMPADQRSNGLVRPRRASALSDVPPRASRRPDSGSRKMSNP